MLFTTFLNTRIIKIKDIKLKGQHNLLNFLAIASCADIYGINIEYIKNVFKSFKGIPHRIEYVTTLMGVDYINDSKATNINSVIVAIKTYNKPTILLLGGVNKGVDFGLLVPHIKSSNIKTILAYGEASEQIKSAIGDAVRLFRINDLNSAVKNAHSIAQPEMLFYYHRVVLVLTNLKILKTEGIFSNLQLELYPNYD